MSFFGFGSKSQADRMDMHESEDEQDSGDSQGSVDTSDYGLTIDEIDDLKEGEVVDYRETNGKYVSYIVDKKLEAQDGADSSTVSVVLSLKRRSTQRHWLVKHIIVKKSCEDVFFKGKTMANADHVSRRLADVRAGNKVTVTIVPTRMKARTAVVRKRVGSQLLVDYDNGQLYWVHCGDDEEVSRFVGKQEKKNQKSRQTQSQSQSQSNRQSSKRGDRGRGGGSGSGRAAVTQSATANNNVYNSNDASYDTSLEWQIQEWSLSGKNGNPHRSPYGHRCGSQQGQQMVNRQELRQKDLVVRTQLLIDGTNDELGLVDRYIDKLMEYHKVANSSNDSRSSTKRKVARLKKELSDANDIVVTGLMPFAMQCRGMRSHGKTENMNFDESYDISRAIIGNYIEKLEDKLENTLNMESDGILFVMNRVKGLTNCMRLALNGKKMPDIPTFANVEFTEEIAGNAISKVVGHSNHTVADRVRNVGNNYKEVGKQQQALRGNLQNNRSGNGDSGARFVEKPNGNDLLRDSQSQTCPAWTREDMDKDFRQDQYDAQHADPNLLN